MFRLFVWVTIFSYCLNFAQFHLQIHTNKRDTNHFEFFVSTRRKEWARWIYPYDISTWTWNITKWYHVHRPLIQITIRNVMRDFFNAFKMMLNAFSLGLQKVFMCKNSVSRKWRTKKKTKEKKKIHQTPFR